MKFNSKSRYGVRTILEIALAENRGIYQKEIAENQNISVKYLDHIINALRIAGLITTVKGKKSGYILTKTAKEISLFDVLSAFETCLCVNECLNPYSKCEHADTCLSISFWKNLNELMLNYMKSTSVQNLIEDYRTNQGKAELLQD